MAFPRLRRWARPVTPLSRVAHRGRWRCSLPVLQPIRGDPAVGAAQGDGVGRRSFRCRAGSSVLSFAALALRAGRVVSTDALSQDLWGLDPPASALGSLQNTVAALRKLLGHDAVLTQPPGYRLAVRPEKVDTNRFERLLREARGAEAAKRARLLHEALALWRGPAPGGPRGGLRAARGSQARETARDGARGAHRRRARARRHPALVGELEQLVALHPLRERLRGQLMLALYRCGRQAEALEVYRATRVALAEELGLEPSAELRRARAQDAAPGSRAGGAGRDRGRGARGAGCRAPARDGPRRDAARGRGPGGAPETSGRDARGGSGRARPARRRARAFRAGRARGRLRLGGAEGRRRRARGSGRHRSWAFPPVSRRARSCREPDRSSTGRSTLARRSGITLDERTRALVGATRRLDAPLVGRVEELAQLRAAFGAARDAGRCRVLTVTGEPGVGKTRLARELAGDERQHATVLTARCVAHGEGAALLPLVELLRRSAWEHAVEGEPDRELVLDAAARDRRGRTGAARRVVLGRAPAARDAWLERNPSCSCSTTCTGRGRRSST